MRLTDPLLIGASFCFAVFIVPTSVHAQRKSAATDLYKKWRQTQPNSFREPGKTSRLLPLPSERLQTSKSVGPATIYLRRPSGTTSGVAQSVGPHIRPPYRRVYPYRYGINSPYRYLIPGINYGVRSPSRAFLPGINYGVRSPDPQVQEFGQWLRSTPP